MNVYWSLDRGEIPDNDTGLCQICREPTALIVDEKHEFCGSCAYRTRVSDLKRIRLFRVAIG